MDEPLFAGCQDECGNFYSQPNLTNLTAVSQFGTTCAECMASISSIVVGPPGDTCLNDSTCGGKILEPQSGRGYNSMDQWCKAAQCVNAHSESCPHYYHVLFGDKPSVIFMRDAGCATTETYCPGCADGGYYNYYQLGNAYAPHVLRR